MISLRGQGVASHEQVTVSDEAQTDSELLQRGSPAPALEWLSSGARLHLALPLKVWGQAGQARVCTGEKYRCPSAPSRLVSDAQDTRIRGGHSSPLYGRMSLLPTLLNALNHL